MLMSSENLPTDCFAAGRPFFIYDAQIIRENVATLRTILGTQKCEGHRLFFSVKANPNLHLIEELKKLVGGFDVSSILELRMLLHAGIKASNITISGPGKTEELLRAGVDAGVEAIHVDSREEFAWLSQFGSPLSLRIANESAAGGKLGLGLTEMRDLLKSAPRSSIIGLHAYFGAESFSMAKVTDFLAIGESLRGEFAAKFGPGFAYYLGPGIPRMDLADKNIDLKNLLDVRTPLHFECGRSILGNAGDYFAPVLSVKRSPKRMVVIVNGGVQHINVQLFSRHSGDRGMRSAVLRSKRVVTTESLPASVYGSLCTENDILHPNVPVPEDIQRGDWIQVGPCGAYNITASNNQFIGQSMAEEWLIDSGSASPGKNAKNISPAGFKAYHESFL